MHNRILVHVNHLPQRHRHLPSKQHQTHGLCHCSTLSHRPSYLELSSSTLHSSTKRTREMVSSAGLRYKDIHLHCHWLVGPSMLSSESCLSNQLTFLQLIVTSVLFTGSRRFNPTSGWFGDSVDEATCRRGPEWYVKNSQLLELC